MYHISSTDGEARAGTFVLPNGREISTPAMLLYTRRGGSLHLTPDLLDTLRPDAQALQLNVFSFIPNSSVLENFPGTAREYLAIDPNFAIVATSRDPGIYEFQGATRQSTDNAISVASHSGSIFVTPEQYITTATSLEPDILVVMSDEVPSDGRRTRAAASVDRTLTWLSRCLDALKKTETASKSSLPAVFACVQGGQYLDYREKCAQGIVQGPFLPSLAGVCVGGLGTGETPEQRAEIIEIALKNVPVEKIRMISSVGTPEEILLAVAQGIDVFDIAFVLDATSAGYALNFPVDYPLEDIQNNIDNSDTSSYESAANSGSDDTKLNLWAVAFKTDSRPLVPGCSCLACKSHTRAYIHHLLESHEMTAQVLLEAHNITHYLKFFKAVQRAVAQGTLQQYINKFMERKQRWIMSIDD